MARRVAALYAMVPATTASSLPRSVIEIEASVTGSLKVAVTCVEVATPVASEAGCLSVSVGFVVSLVLVLYTTSTQ